MKSNAPPFAALPTATPAAWAEALAQRVNCYGLGLWFRPLGQWLELPPDLRWLPQSCADGPQQVPAAHRAVQLSVAPLRTFDAAPRRARHHHLVLDRLWFNGRMVRERPGTCALPFGLDAHAATPEQVAATLGASPLKQSEDTFDYALADGRSVIISFEPAQTGIARVALSRFGEPVLWG
ncbi:hypothetical protein J5J83_07610 [Azoarcus sp. L1K30]|uniref:hypothetical protein n=1 Tax=Azoarcus sp. L1K30 TaxID=2820277 RepID=UPI001B81467C|nr:hypothetical protein [Azoarcus sp. L1K30]MBR0565979.1 hypothetical protein [Azoarcus sp. L1K30]